MNNAIITAADLTLAVKAVLDDNNVPTKQAAGIVTGTAWAVAARLVNASVNVLLAQKDQRGKGTDAQVSRLRKAEERLAAAGALAGAFLPYATSLGIDCNALLKGFIESAGLPSAAKQAKALDEARAAALALVAKVGGSEAIKQADRALAARSAEERTYLQDKGTELRALVAGAVREAGACKHPLDHEVAAREFERLWESATRQASWVLQDLQRARLPSRVATLGADAAALALAAREFETYAEAHYAHAAEEDATPPEGETFAFGQALGLGVFDL